VNRRQLLAGLVAVPVLALTGCEGQKSKTITPDQDFLKHLEDQKKYAKNNPPKTKKLKRGKRPKRGKRACTIRGVPGCP
jgi:hypothetical protein